MSERRRDAEKARAAAAHPDRPGDDCKAAPRTVLPVVDRARCEGKADCVAVCPYGVFEVRTMDAHEYDALPFFSRFRSWVHDKQTAYTPHQDACRGCGLCVVACPERAIVLHRADAPFPTESH